MNFKYFIILIISFDRTCQNKKRHDNNTYVIFLALTRMCNNNILAETGERENRTTTHAGHLWPAPQ